MRIEVSLFSLAFRNAVITIHSPYVLERLPAGSVGPHGGLRDTVDANSAGAREGPRFFYRRALCSLSAPAIHEICNFVSQCQP